MLTIVINLLLVLHVLVCGLIVLAVLMQRPKNEGLGAAFGGGMTDSLFGAQTTNVLASITRWLGVFFFGLTLVLSALYARQGRQQTGVQRQLEQSAQPLFTTPVVDPGSDTVPAPDAPKADAPKADAPKADAPKADAPKADAPKADAPKADAPKADAPKADAPKADAPKADAPKAEDVKLDVPLRAQPDKDLGPVPVPSGGNK
jgi:preprotein translocase subunit SecG